MGWGDWEAKQPTVERRVREIINLYEAKFNMYCQEMSFARDTQTGAGHKPALQNMSWNSFGYE